VRAINVETLSGKLSLIDLAGSERGTVTENRGLRLM
jgi:kinesin family member 18/19